MISIDGKSKDISPACFIETMDCSPVSKLPEGTGWTYEIKPDGLP
jgi:hypothetical protein